MLRMLNRDHFRFKQSLSRIPKIRANERKALWEACPDLSLSTGSRKATIKIPPKGGNSGCLPCATIGIGWNVNGKRFFGSPHWEIPGTNGNSEKVVPFSRLGRSQWKFVYHLQVSWVSHQFHVVTSIQSRAARQSGNFRQMRKDTYRSYRWKIPNQNFRNFFINGKQPACSRVQVCKRMRPAAWFISLLLLMITF